MPDMIVTTSDAFPLAATTFGRPDDARACVLVAGAMGVAQSYYTAFAEWLAARGFFVVTFDYRGIGRSRPAAYRRSLRGFEADLTTWATRDCAAMVEFAVAAAPGRKLLWIGHSLGAQILGLVSNREKVAAMASVAAGSGYWLQNSWRLRISVWWLWFVAVPLAIRLFGYFPGRRLRKVGDLPADAMRQWRRWCLHRDYVVGAEGEAARRRFAEVDTPIMSLSFTDDEFMSAANIASLHGFYASAPRDMRRLGPGDIGASRIGHFGFFRRPFEATLWPMVGDWLAAHA